MNHYPPARGDTSPLRRLHLAVALLLGALILAHMALIFYFSSESGEVSGDRSAGVTAVITEIIRPDLHELPPAEQQDTLDSIHLAVRKTAHFLEYALLGLLTAWLALHLRRHLLPRICQWQTWVLPAGFCLLYAASDEIHQIFSGRGPRVTDVLIDFAGAIFGIACLHLCGWLIGWLRAGSRHRKEGKEAL